jgi:flagellar assembly protein FliH
VKTPSSSRIIGAEDLRQVRRFTMSEFRDDPGASAAGPAADPMADDPAYVAGHGAGQRDGFKRGFEAARQQMAREQARQRAEAVDQVGARAMQLTAALGEQFAAIEQSIADELIGLSVELARQLLRRALQVERDVIVTVVQEAVAALIDERANFSVHINPSDLAHVGETLGAVLAGRNGRLVADPTIAAGGCRVLSPGAEVDSTLETRWRRVLASIGRDPAPEDGLTDA